MTLFLVNFRGEGFLYSSTYFNKINFMSAKLRAFIFHSNGVDAVDGPGRDPELRPFCSRSRSLMIFMPKNPNSSVSHGLSVHATNLHRAQLNFEINFCFSFLIFQATAPSIEHTRMPHTAWGPYSSESSTLRMASINENAKRPSQQDPWRRRRKKINYSNTFSHASHHVSDAETRW